MRFARSEISSRPTKSLRPQTPAGELRLAIWLAAPALLMVCPPAFAGQQISPLGEWRTEKAGGRVDIRRCGSGLCGHVVDGAPLRANPDQRDVRNPDPALRARRVMGLQVIGPFTGGPREWKGGPLYDPETGDAARRGTLTLTDANTLTVKACIMPLLCRTQRWTRVR